MAVVRFRDARIAFPELFEASQYNGQGPYSYRATFLLDKSGKCEIETAPGQWKPTTIQQVIKDVAVAQFKAKADAVLAAAKNNSQKICLVDGDTKTWDGAAGHLVLSASKNRDKGPVSVKVGGKTLHTSDGTIYGGCYVHASVEVWAQDNEFGKGIRATLRQVAFSKEGESFGGGTPVRDDELDDLSNGADASSLV